MGQGIIASGYSRLGRSIFGAALLLNLGAVPASACENEWSFSDHPQPGTSDSALYDTPGVIGETESAFYGRKVNDAYDRYRALYPAYGASRSDDAAKDIWIRHILTGQWSPLQSHVSSAMVFEFVDLMAEMAPSDLLYCGHWSRAPENRTETRFKTIVDHLAAHAEVGGPDAALNLATLRHSPNIAYNTDIRYYLAALSHRKNTQSQILERQGYGKGRITGPTKANVHKLAASLSPERLDAIDRALAKDDFAAVLRTTGPCKTPDPTPAAPL